MAPHSWHTLQVSQWREEFWTMNWMHNLPSFSEHTVIPQTWSLCLIISSTLSVNKLCILFLRMMIDLRLNCNEHTSGRMVSISRLKHKSHTWPCQTDQWYFLVNWLKTWSQKWHLLEQPNMPRHTVSSSRSVTTILTTKLGLQKAEMLRSSGQNQANKWTLWFQCLYTSPNLVMGV